MNQSLRIGIDFDNTIVKYDAVFAASAAYLALPVATATDKTAIRAAVRALPDGERHWQRLQAHVYGAGIAHAVAFAGFDDFLARCGRRAVPVWIVSHKTPYAAADPDGVNLRSAAAAWLSASGIARAGGPIREVYFESTREAKIARIAELNCTHFIDDLEEVLSEPAFPAETRRVLFGAERTTLTPPVDVCADWPAVARLVLGDES